MGTNAINKATRNRTSERAQASERVLQQWETNSTVDDRIRRKDLSCSLCKPNRGENAKRKPRPDRHKNKRR